MEENELSEEDFIKSPTTHDIDPNLYFEILEYLTGNGGVNVEIEITELLSKHFKNKTLADIYWDLKSEDFEKYLKPMEDEGHVRLRFDKTERKTNYPQGQGLAFATLKANGLLFYYQKLQVDSTIAVNNSIVNTNEIVSNRTRRQTSIFAWTAAFAFGTLILGFTTTYLDISNNRKDQIILKLQQDTTQLQHQLSHYGSHNTK